MTRPISSETLHQALVDAGVIRTGERIRRLVIDAQVDHPVVIHVERIGDERLLNVAVGLDGVCIGFDRACPCPDGDPCHYRDDPVTGTKAMAVPDARKSTAGGGQ